MNPGTPPIRPIPSIKEVLEPVALAQKPETAPAPEPEAEPQHDSPPAGDNATLAEPDSNTEPPTGTTSDSDEQPEDFATCWNVMFEELFSGTPMIYHPLKDKIPTLEDGIIKAEVLNVFQKEQYEMRKRAMLEYWRSHFQINVDDMEITVNANMEMKKIIYSAEDKMESMMEQNPALADFLKTLNFRIKD